MPLSPSGHCGTSWARELQCIVEQDWIQLIAILLPLNLWHLTSRDCRYAATEESKDDAVFYCRKAAIAGEEMLDFLKGIVESVPDHGNEEEAAPQEKQPKRRR